MGALAAEEAIGHAAPFYLAAEFWLTVAFVIFVGLLFRPVTRMITSALDDRSDAIAKELDEARRLAEDAQAALADYQRKQRDAVKEAEEILARGEAEAKRMGEAAARDLAAALERRGQLAMENIAQAEARAVDEVRNAAIDMALGATRKLIEENVDKGKSDALVEDAIKELPDKLH
ncbi:MAG: F0F1 ATP synthase subunit B [Proteobacteria bacterium]|nr:F0F1 ATP synthase subunit B [Pseudomonadota bacterium]